MLLDKVNGDARFVGVPFDVDTSQGETMEAPVMVTPTIFIGAKVTGWAVGAFAAGLGIGRAIGR